MASALKCDYPASPGCSTNTNLKATFSTGPEVFGTLP
jgi:hypothetical protein